MAIARWTPMGELSTLHSSIDRLFSDLLEASMSDSSGTGRSAKKPEQPLAIDVKETKNGFEVRAPVPGFKPDEVDVSVRDGILTIKAHHTEERQQEEGGYIRREMFTGNLVRRLMLPQDVAADDLKADVEDGILTITIPRRKPAESSQRVKVSRRSRSADDGKSAKPAGASAKN